jgi:hypothetical protein
MPVPILAHELARDRLDPRHLVEAVLFARLYDPEAALQVGWLDRLAEPDQLEAEAISAAQLLAALPAPAYAHTKRSLRRATIEHIRATVEQKPRPVHHHRRLSAPACAGRRPRGLIAPFTAEGEHADHTHDLPSQRGGCPFHRVQRRRRRERHGQRDGRNPRSHNHRRIDDRPPPPPAAPPPPTPPPAPARTPTPRATAPPPPPPPAARATAPPPPTGSPKAPRPPRAPPAPPPPPIPSAATASSRAMKSATTPTRTTATSA